MAILRAGRIVAACTPEEAVRELVGRIWEAVVPPGALADLRSRVAVVAATPCVEGVRVRVLADGGRPLDAFSPTAPTLEDYYLRTARLG